MAWTTPRTWIPGELLTASLLNTHLRDNLLDRYNNGGIFHSYVAFDAVITPTQINSSANDYSPTGFTTCNMMRLSGSGGSQQITGFAAPSPPYGRLCRLFNIGPAQLNFLHESTDSSANNRIITTTLTTIVLTLDDPGSIWYDVITQRWRLWG